MLILGLLLIIVAAALTVGAVYDGGESARVEILGYDLSTTVAGVFFVGMATTALLLFGVWLMQASLGRARRRRAERKEAKVRQHDSVSRLEDERAKLRAENERLAQKLERERGSSTGTGEAAGSPANGLETSSAGTTGVTATSAGHDDTHSDRGIARDDTAAGGKSASSGATDLQHRDGPRHARDST